MSGSVSPRSVTSVRKTRTESPPFTKQGSWSARETARAKMMESPTETRFPGGSGRIALQLRPRSTSEILRSSAGKVFTGSPRTRKAARATLNSSLAEGYLPTSGRPDRSGLVLPDPIRLSEWFGLIRAASGECGAMTVSRWGTPTRRSPKWKEGSAQAYPSNVVTPGALKNACRPHIRPRSDRRRSRHPRSDRHHSRRHLHDLHGAWLR